MKSKQIPLRAVGQKTIDSSFLISSSNPFKVSSDGSGNKASEKGSPLSLSDFLEKKLNGTCGLARTVKGKSKPFSSVVGPRELSGSIENKGNEPSLNSDIEKVVLQQFKPIECCIAKADCVDSGGFIGHEAANSSNSLLVQGTRKRKFEGGSERKVPRKHFAVFGGDIKKRTRQRRDKNISKDDEIPTYNHYANGGGFWDSNMEGIDNEEVGFSEVWEGVGSTTFGGIVDWH